MYEGRPLDPGTLSFSRGEEFLRLAAWLMARPEPGKGGSGSGSEASVRRVATSLAATDRTPDTQKHTEWVTAQLLSGSKGWFWV